MYPIAKIPAHFKCPMCHEAPTSKVFQCRRGHKLCEECYIQLSIPNSSSCPECRLPLPGEPPVHRTVPVKRVVNEWKLNCPYQINGCEESVFRKALPSHAKDCMYNIARFGAFVDVCKIIGSEDCSFQTNRGNIAEAMQHLKSVHEAAVYNFGDIFNLEPNMGKVRRHNFSGDEDGGRKCVVLNRKRDGCAFLIDLSISQGPNKCISTRTYYWLYPNGRSSSSPPPYQVQCSLIKPNHFLTWSVPPIDILEGEREHPEIFSMSLPAYWFVDESVDSLSMHFELV